MKRFLIYISLLFFSVSLLAAQEIDLINIPKDALDSIFDEPSDEFYGDESFAAVETPSRQTSEQSPSAPVLRSVRRRGVEFSAAYNFRGAINPGWDMYPWEFDGEEEFSWAIALRMRGTIGINARITESLRIYNSFRFEMPAGNATSLSTTTTNTETTSPNGQTTITESTVIRESAINPVFSFLDFYLDYNFADKVFLRVGKFSQSWGVSRNFSFTNILARVPDPKKAQKEGRNPRGGASYIVKLDIPVDIGGLQLLAMTRVNIAGNITPIREDIGYGAKYNLAFDWANFDLGFYMQDGLPTRAFLSAKTTLWDTDFYNEYLASYDNSLEFAFNFGFSKSLLNDRMEIGGEYFFNGEDIDYQDYFRAETDFRVEGISRLPYGSSIALNFLYRFDTEMNPRFFTRFRYSVEEDSFSFVPGFRITPFQNIEVYLAIPMALGNKEGFYYEDSKNVLNQPRPFSFLFYVTFSGSVRASHYY